MQPTKETLEKIAEELENREKVQRKECARLLSVRRSAIADGQAIAYSSAAELLRVLAEKED